MTDRWHNILGSSAFDKINVALDELHKNAEDAGFTLKIYDETCPHCGFKPLFEMKEHQEKKQAARAKQQAKQLPLL
jgi:hypothetical protein